MSVSHNLIILWVMDNDCLCYNICECESDFLRNSSPEDFSIFHKESLQCSLFFDEHDQVCLYKYFWKRAIEFCLTIFRLITYSFIYVYLDVNLNAN